MLDFVQFDWISFDCYGTLIDWESGILRYLKPLLHRKGCGLSDSGILDLYSEFEPREQAGSYRRYRDVLASVVGDFANELHFHATPDEIAGLAESIREWAPLPDAVPTLRSLRSRYRLAVLSNIDDDLFACSAQKLQVTFDCVVTAQQAQAYKPSSTNFGLLLEKLSVVRSRLLHVAESLFHDIAPANKLGIATVWVNRRQGRPSGASKYVETKPDLEVPDLAALAKLISTARGEG